MLILLSLLRTSWLKNAHSPTFSCRTALYWYSTRFWVPGFLTCTPRLWKRLRSGVGQRETWFWPLSAGECECIYSLAWNQTMIGRDWPILSLLPRVFGYINHAVRHSGLVRDMFSIVIVMVIVIIIIIIIIIIMSLATSGGWSSKYPSTPPPRLCFAPQAHCRIGRHEAVDNAKELLDTLVQANILR